jgi:cobalt-zinc-cadmium efflux system membrane fusion protein
LPAPAPASTEAAAPAKPSNTVAMTQQALTASQIAVAPAASGELDAAILASATVEATPDAEAVLTARAPGTVSRIMVRIGDPVRAGQTLALVESRDASQIAADRSAASARVTLAARQLERERGLLAQGVTPRADYDRHRPTSRSPRPMPAAPAPPQALRVSGDGRSVAVVSPVSGRVTNAGANLGQFVAAETELFRVADPRRLQIMASVPLPMRAVSERATGWN